MRGYAQTRPDGRRFRVCAMCRVPDDPRRRPRMRTGWPAASGARQTASGTHASGFGHGFMRPTTSGFGFTRVASSCLGAHGRLRLCVAGGLGCAGLHCERPRVYGCRPGLLRVTDGFGRARLAMGRKFAASWQVLTENGKWKAANRDIEGKAILERCVLPDRSHSIFRYAERASGRLPISGKTCHIRAL